MSLSPPSAVRHTLTPVSGVFLGARNSLSRGTTIITQKENKGEYNGIGCWNNNGAKQCDGGWIGGNWYWQESDSRDIYAHVFDQNGKKGTTDGVPIRYANNSTNYASTNNIPQCTSDYSTTSGNTLYSGTKITNQFSCNPYLNNPGLNAGNWYNFPAATAGSNNASTTSAKDMPNSICPKGWRLPPNAGNKSYNTLIRTAYGLTATNSDSALLNNSAMSFVRLGHYYYVYGALEDRGKSGHYWSSTAYSFTGSYHLNFYSGLLSPQHGDNRVLGFSIRCVSR